ncbi:MAG: TadE/TadG family type IV pilus assembly protein [Acidimicrobiales bacterium]
MNRPRSHPRVGDGGSSTTIELILLTPLALAVLFFLVIAGRVGTVTGEVAAASRDAARAASLAQTPAEAADAARTAAAASLGDRNVTCDRLTVVLGDPVTFVAGGEVAATVSCDVSLVDVALPGIPGTRTVTATSVEVIDQHRGVGR